MPEDPETGLERIGGIVALLLWTILLVEGLGITIIVGVSGIGPRPAALLMVLPTLIVWVLASNQKRLRQAALVLPFT